MRVNITRRSSTKAERKFIELLKKHHIPFKHRVKQAGMEIDFIIGNYAIEIDGHFQKGERNRKMIQLGYTPVHYHNHAIMHNISAVEKDIVDKYGLHTSSNRPESVDRKS